MLQAPPASALVPVPKPAAGVAGAPKYPTVQYSTNMGLDPDTPIPFGVAQQAAQKGAAMAHAAGYNQGAADVGDALKGLVDQQAGLIANLGAYADPELVGKMADDLVAYSNKVNELYEYTGQLADRMDAHKNEAERLRSVLADASLTFEQRAQYTAALEEMVNALNNERAEYAQVIAQLQTLLSQTEAERLRLQGEGQQLLDAAIQTVASKDAYIADLAVKLEQADAEKTAIKNAAENEKAAIVAEGKSLLEQQKEQLVKMGDEYYGNIIADLKKQHAISLDSLRAREKANVEKLKLFVDANIQNIIAQAKEEELAKFDAAGKDLLEKLSEKEKMLSKCMADQTMYKQDMMALKDDYSALLKKHATSALAPISAKQEPVPKPAAAMATLPKLSAPAAPAVTFRTRTVTEREKAQAIARARWALHPKAEATDKGIQAKKVVTKAADYVPEKNDFAGVDTKTAKK